MGGCCRYVEPKLLGVPFVINVLITLHTEAVAKQDDAETGYTGTSRSAPRRDFDEPGNTSDHDENRYEGEGILPDDEEF